MADSRRKPKPANAARDERIRQLAGRGGWSERELAVKFGLSRTRIWQIKRADS